MKEAKKASFEKFTASISPASTPKKIWADIKSLTGVPYTPIRSINYNQSLLTSSIEIANSFAETWSNYSNDSNFSSEYKAAKSVTISKSYIFQPTSKTAIDLNLKSLS